MVYDPKTYVLDAAHGFDPDASLEDGAVLYRITSRTYSGRTEILTGNGAALGVSEGRYHRVNQRATYCANNAMVCLSEMLYRLYRALLDGIKDELPPADLKKRTGWKRAFVVLAVSKIDDIIYADSVGARQYNPHITGPSITCPDAVYYPLQKFGDEVRKVSKSGVVYPSARHSEGFAYALFNDETSRIQSTPFEALEINLQLVSENQDFSIKPPNKFDIYREKLHPTIGYYEFTDAAAFNKLKAHGLIYPDGLTERGYVDFVRRRYDRTTYPQTAHMPC
jgi:hypothetical protein